MSGDREREFRRFVVACRPALLRTACLLTGDARSAEELVQTALLRSYRHWDGVASGDAPASARRVLVSAYLSPWRRVSQAEQVLTGVPDRAPAFEDERDDELLAALRGLAPRLRAVIVLRWYEDLSETETAELLGCPVGTVTTETSEALALLLDVLTVPVSGGGPAVAFETDLRERLTRAAGQDVVPGDDGAAADAVIERRRAELRRRGALTVTALCLLPLLIPLLFVAGRWLTDSTAPPAGGPPAPPAPALATDAPATWTDPTRGSLAHDAGFLETIRARSWTATDGEPAPANPTVAFAGDVSGIRWALVVGTSNGELRGQWFTGPAGAPAAALDPGALEYRVLPGLPLGAVRDDASGATLLVVARPGDDVQVSPAITVDASGKVRRPFSSVDTRDGIAVIREGGINAGASLRYRVLRNGLLAGVGPSSSALATPEQELGATSGQAPRRPSSGTAPASAFAQALGHVLTATGLGPADVNPVLLWNGPVPAVRGVTVQGTIVVATMPSGALVTGTAIGGPAGAEENSFGLCGTTVSPAGTALGDVVVVVGCEVTRAEETQRSFVVSAPAGYDTVTLRSADGRVLGTQALVAGSGSIVDPGTVATAVLSGPGRAQLEVTPADPRDDALDVS